MQRSGGVLEKFSHVYIFFMFTCTGEVGGLQSGSHDGFFGDGPCLGFCRILLNAAPAVITTKASVANVVKASSGVKKIVVMPKRTLVTII